MTMHSKFDVVVLGRCVQDHAFVVDADIQALLRSDEEHFEASDFVVMGGGPGATAAVAMAAAGLRVAFIGRVGRDLLGTQIRDELLSFGVDVAGLEVDSSIRSRAALVLVNPRTNTRSFITFGTTFIDRPSAAQRKILDQSDALHVDWATDVSLAIAQSFRRAGRQVTFDVFVFADRVPALSRCCTVVSLARKAAAEWLRRDATISQQATEFSSDAFYEVGTRLAAMTGTATLVTLGERGCLMSANENVTYLEAYRPLRIVDTTGAGDVFNGVLAWGLRSALPLEVAVQKAQAAASIACEGFGGRGRIPTVEDIERRYASQAPRISRIRPSSDESRTVSP